MTDEHFYKKISTNPDIINNFEYLKKIGIIDILQELNSEITNLNEVIKEAIELFNKDSINDLLDYITKQLLNKFIPSYLAFIIQEEFNPDNAYIICYNNLKLINNIIQLNSISPYKKFFSLSPTTIEFNAFQNMIEDKKLTDLFLPLNPELLVPLMGHDSLYGFIVFGAKIVGTKYTEQELNYINKIMKFASVSLQNYINHKRSIYDNKTKLYTHAYFMKKLEEELQRIKRYNNKISILMIDIDFFKKINDTFGHIAGDIILEEFAKIIINEIRNVDIAARFGGEEFIVLLTECSEENAFNVSERIRKKIENTKIKYSDSLINATISIGVSYCLKENFFDSYKLIKNADTALYKSKTDGRNKTTIFK